MEVVRLVALAVWLSQEKVPNTETTHPSVEVPVCSSMRTYKVTVPLLVIERNVYVVIKQNVLVLDVQIVIT
jgi:hypothetical protein